MKLGYKTKNVIFFKEYMNRFLENTLQGQTIIYNKIDIDRQTERDRVREREREREKGGERKNREGKEGRKDGRRRDGGKWFESWPEEQ